MSVWRELKRAGELRVVAAALVVAVAAVSTIGFFTDRVQGALDSRATALLGADLMLSSTAGIDPAVHAKIDELGLRSVSVIEFPSVALTDDDDSSLIAVKVVAEGYPLRGELQISEQLGSAVAIADGIPAAGEFWVESKLLSELGLAVGDSIQVGRLNQAITRVIHYESDRGGALFQVAPRVMFNQADLDDSGLITEGSRVRYALQLGGEQSALESLQSWTKAQEYPGLQIQGVRDARPEIRTALDRVGRFLGLAAMLTVLVAGAAITVALQGLVQRESDAAAIKRCFGATQAEVLGQLFQRLAVVSLAASAIGLLLGFIMQAVISSAIGQWFDAELPAPGALPALAGFATGLITLIGFGLPSVLRIRQVPVVRVLRRELGAPPAAAWAVAGTALAALGLLLLWQAKSATLAALVLVSMLVAVVL
ncbi:MAG: ABC transporter permease, partial [Granulosicoccaceae bacterium]